MVVLDGGERGSADVATRIAATSEPVGDRLASACCSKSALNVSAVLATR